MADFICFNHKVVHGFHFYYRYPDRLEKNEDRCSESFHFAMIPKNL